MTLQAQHAELVEESTETSDEPLELTLESGTDDDTAAAQAAPTQPASQAAQTSEEALDGDDIPDKYRGKSARELLEVLREQESYVGRQANELGQLREQVGTLRGVVDKAIAVTAGEAAPSRTAEDEAELSADELLTNPGEAIGRVIQKHLQPFQEQSAKSAAQKREEAFISNHPTAQADLNDQKFVEFVQGSPYRQRLARRAFADPTNIDYDAAEELWLGYDEVVGRTGAPAEETTETEEQQPKAPTPSASEVALVRSGGSGDTPTSDKTIYSAQALTRLQMEDPDKYYDPAFYDKVARAFQEGRVK